MAIPSQMKSWITSQDGIDNLQIIEAQVPQPGDKEVLVKISAVSLNYRDTEGQEPEASKTDIRKND